MRGPVQALLVVLVLALPAAAFGRDGLPTVEQARQAHGATRPDGSVAGGAVTVTPTEGIASVTRTVEIELHRGSALEVGFPERFAQRGPNGRAFVAGTPSSAVVDAGARLSIDVSGLPAGTYRLPLRRDGKPAGTAVFRLYAASREGEEADRQALPSAFGRLARVEIDTSQDSTEESETFIAVDPSDPNRIVTAANDIEPSGFGGVRVSNDGGANWVPVTFPTTFKTSAVATDTELPSGDPILAADTLGNVWAGGLSVCQAGSKSHIFVNRLAAGSPGATDFGGKPNVAIPTLHSGGTCGTSAEVLQDKPQMTIDNGPSSPTKGRLYVTWDDPDPSGATNEVLAYCDTQPLVSACDSPANWKGPVVISDAPGSYITSDPAVGPDGKVYVAWWDYSATNAIAIDSCTPAAITNRCDQTTNWSTDKVVASLSTHLHDVPFACATLAQPGGRAAPVPSVAVDDTTGANAGRIYVAWSDLGSTGSTRCSVTISGGGLSMSLPDSSQDAWNSYVASAPDLATLTTDPATTSGERGTNIISDPGDQWFPWVAVDQSTGQAYVDLYSTRDDQTRRSANFYVRAVVPGTGTQVKYGALTQASAEPTNYSDQPCGGFGNDYGDYTGLAAAGGFAFPVWTHRLLGGDGDAYINELTPAATSPVSPADDPALPPPSARLAQCEPPPPLPPPPPATTTTTTTTTPPPPPPPVDRTAPKLSGTFPTRVDRRGRYTLKLKAAGEPASGSAVLRLATGSRRKLASGLIATSGTQPIKLVLRLKRKDLKLLKRKHKLRVRLTVSLTDLAGNTARGAGTFTLRLSRR